MIRQAHALTPPSGRTGNRRGYRVGAVQYLNRAGLDLVYDLPSRLADRLAAGALDVALVPVVELFRQPAHGIVSDACIACRGPVMSVKLLFRTAPHRVTTLAVDEGVGKVLEALAESGQLEHTLVIYSSDQGFANGEHGMRAKLAPYAVELIVQAGWMHLFTMAFLKHYPGKVLNIHPALPGAFPGMHAIERAYEAFQRGEIHRTGVMIHRVPDEAVDEGPVVACREVPIYPDDTLESLEARIHAVEHELYVQAIAQELGLIKRGE